MVCVSVYRAKADMRWRVRPCAVTAVATGGVHRHFQRGLGTLPTWQKGFATIALKPGRAVVNAIGTYRPMRSPPGNGEGRGNRRLLEGRT